VAVTIGAGVLALATKSNWWSYLMAVGFLASLLIYFVLVLRAQVHLPQASSHGC
jgi:amino acid permease